MSPAKTASNDQSIWSDISSRVFYENVARLQNLSEVPLAPQTYAPEDFNRPDPRGVRYALPKGVELQLADDFAFLASPTEGANGVTCAALETLTNPDKLKIVIAANKGVSTNAETCVRETLKSLEKCAKGLSRDATTNEIFGIFVQYHRNRIYGRLGSRKWRRPMDYEKRKRDEPLSRYFSLLVERGKPPHNVTGPNLSLPGFFEAAEDARSAFERMEQNASMEEDDGDDIQLLLKSIFQLSTNGISFEKNLQALQIPIDAKCVNRIGKLSSYWRISLGLPRKSRAYRQMFLNSSIQLLPKYNAISLPIGSGVQRRVHAEVQIIAHYETQKKPAHLPRFIGASKDACYLCDAFVRAHGVFALSKSHRQLHEKWAVPDRQDYIKPGRNRIRKALVKVNKDMLALVIAATSQGKYPKFPHPAQSSINLFLSQSVDGSLLTVRGSSSTAESSVSAISRSTIRDSPVAESGALQPSAMESTPDTPNSEDKHNCNYETKVLSTQPSYDNDTVVERCKTKDPDITTRSTASSLKAPFQVTHSALKSDESINKISDTSKNYQCHSTPSSSQLIPEQGEDQIHLTHGNEPFHTNPLVPASTPSNSSSSSTITSQTSPIKVFTTSLGPVNKLGQERNNKDHIYLTPTSQTAVEINNINFHISLDQPLQEDSNQEKTTIQNGKRYTQGEITFQTLGKSEFEGERENISKVYLDQMEEGRDVTLVRKEEIEKLSFYLLKGDEILRMDCSWI